MNMLWSILKVTGSASNEMPPLYNEMTEKNREQSLPQDTITRESVKRAFLARIKVR